MGFCYAPEMHRTVEVVSDLSHDGNEGGLADVAGLAPHVGTCDDQSTWAPCGQVCVIGHNRGVKSHIQNWVAALDNAQLCWLVFTHKLWPSVPGNTCKKSVVPVCPECLIMGQLMRPQRQ